MEDDFTEEEGRELQIVEETHEWLEALLKQVVDADTDECYAMVVVVLNSILDCVEEEAKQAELATAQSAEPDTIATSAVMLGGSSNAAVVEGDESDTMIAKRCVVEEVVDQAELSTAQDLADTSGIATSATTSDGLAPAPSSTTSTWVPASPSPKPLSSSHPHNDYIIIYRSSDLSEADLSDLKDHLDAGGLICTGGMTAPH